MHGKLKLVDPLLKSWISRRTSASTCSHIANGATVWCLLQDISTLASEEKKCFSIQAETLGNECCALYLFNYPAGGQHMMIPVSSHAGENYWEHNATGCHSNRNKKKEIEPGGERKP